MEFFGQVNIHWMSKAKYFFSLSGFLLLVGIIACIHNGGLTYGIDFKGGTLVTVRFAQPPDVNAIRHDLEKQGLTENTIQSTHDPSNPNANEIVIGLEEKGQGEEALEAGKTTIINALNQSFPPSDPSKKDFNAQSATPAEFAEYLVSKDPLSLGTAAGDRYTQIGLQAATFRDKDRNGLVASMADLSSSGLPQQ